MDRPRVVRPGARVQDHPVGHPGQVVQVLDELALGVGLEAARVQPQLVPELLDRSARAPAACARRSAPGRGGRARRSSRRASPDAGTSDQSTGLMTAASSATAARSCASATAQPTRTAPGASTSTNGGRAAPRRFLSWATASSTARGAAPCSVTGNPRREQQPRPLRAAAPVRRAERGEQAERDGLAVAVARVAGRASRSHDRSCGRGSEAAGARRRARPRRRSRASYARRRGSRAR